MSSEFQDEGKGRLLEGSIPYIALSIVLSYHRTLQIPSNLGRKLHVYSLRRLGAACRALYKEHVSRTALEFLLLSDVLLPENPLFPNTASASSLYSRAQRQLLLSKMTFYQPSAVTVFKSISFQLGEIKQTSLLWRCVCFSIICFEDSQYSAICLESLGLFVRSKGTSSSCATQLLIRVTCLAFFTAITQL